MKHTRTEILIDGFSFAEGPRWREDRLWFSDMIGQKVYTVDLKGNLKEIVEVPNRPSGLGFLQDGTLLIASMRDNRLLHFDGHELALHADLQSLAVGEINDMVVDRAGRAYVGSFDFHRSVHGACERGCLILVDSQGRAQVAVNGLRFPNGAAVTADDKTLIVAETFGNRLLAFDIGPDGNLSGERTFADLHSFSPDGICLDSEGAIWVAAAAKPVFVRVLEGGRVTDEVQLPARQAVACQLGGADGHTLFCLSASEDFEGDGRDNTSARIDICRVDVPGGSV
jgi:sugar lactone lactonase YvrE